MLYSRIIVVLLLCFLGSVNIGHAQKVNIEITGVKSPKGDVRLYLFDSQKGFKDDKPYKVLSYSKKNYKNGKVSLTLNMSEGIHGISLIDDENSNKEMDYNIIKMPKEGFGFSDYYHTGLSMPRFDDFKFSLAKGETKNIVVKMRYL